MRAVIHSPACSFIALAIALAGCAGPREAPPPATGASASASASAGISDDAVAPRLDDSYRTDPPGCIAVMPFTASASAAADSALRRQGLASVRRAVFGHLSLHGKRDIALGRVDFVLSKLSGGRAIDPQAIGERLDCDALLFGEVLTYRTDTAGIHGGIHAGIHMVGARLQLVRARDGRTLWEHRQTLTNDGGRLHASPVAIAMGLDDAARVLHDGGRLIVVDTLARRMIETLPDAGAMAAYDPTRPAPSYTVRDALSDASAVMAVIARDASRAAAHLGYARFLLHEGDYAEALEAAREALVIEPEAHEIAFLIGRIQLRMNRLADAERSMLRALALAPAEASYLNGLGYAYSRMGRHDDALATYAMALKHQPVNGFAYYNVGVTLFNGGDKKSARDAFYRAGLAHYRSGRFDLAARAAADLRALAKTGIDVARPLARLEAELARLSSRQRKDV